MIVAGLVSFWIKVVRVIIF